MEKMVAMEIAMAGSEEDEDAGVVFVFVMMCMAIGKEGLWGGTGSVLCPRIRKLISPVHLFNLEELRSVKRFLIFLFPPL
jgi:hypothetical protein